MSSLEQSKNQIIPPNNIVIDDFQYVIKGRYANGDVSYRCPFRNKCKIIIRIKKDDIFVIKEKQNIKYDIVSSQKTHSYKNIEKNEKEKEGEINSIDKLKKLASELIKQNLQKPLSFHIDIITKANIPLTKRQIKYLLQKIREINLPSDDIFLNDLKNITISLEDNIPELKNLPFFFAEEKIINFEEHNKLESFIILSTPFHIKLMNEATQIFIDGTFKSTPKKYYQLLNIIISDKKESFFPVMYILMTSKSTFLYSNLFLKIEQLLNYFKIKLDYNIVSFMTDFEKGLRKSLKKVFVGAKIYGCYFHFIKNLWEKAKRCGLFSKILKKGTFILIFSMKLFPYIKENIKEEYLNNMEKYIKTLENKEKYISFFNYFKKNWAPINFLKFDGLAPDEYFKRTNNVCEWFHKSLNDSIEGYHPKISYLIEKLKIFSIKSYNKYKIEKIFFNKEIKHGNNIADDILKFLKKFKKKYKKLPSFNNLLQLDEQEEKFKNDLIISIVDNLYNLDLDEKNESSQLNDIDNEIEEWQNEKNENYIELDYAEKENIFESDDKVFDTLNQEEENSENFYAFENDDELNKISENERSYLDKYLY